MSDAFKGPDEIDRRILRVIELQGRATLAAIGESVGLSAPAVKRRLDRLESTGIVRGYTAVIDQALLGVGLEAFVELRFVGTAPVHSIEALADEVSEIYALFTVAGDPDALAWIRARDVHDLTRVIDLIRRSGLVAGTKTLIVLASRIKVHGAKSMDQVSTT